MFNWFSFFTPPNDHRNRPIPEDRAHARRRMRELRRLRDARLFAQRTHL